jgi:hypothetical protein
MTPDEIATTEIILAETKVVDPPAEELPLDSEGLSRLLDAAGIVTGTFDWRTQTFTGVTVQGLQASEALARSLRDGLGVIGKSSANGAVASLIRQYVFSNWRGRTSTQLAPADFTALAQAVADWLSAQTKIRRHFIPCTLFKYQLPSFAVGPVRFHHFYDLPTPSMAVTRDEFWPDSKRTLRRRLRDAWEAFRGQPHVPALEEFGRSPGGFHYEYLVRLCHERRAYWVAEVEVAGREQAQSSVVANLAASIAIAALTLALPGDELRDMSRASERATPVWGFDVWAGDDRGSRSSNREPGRTLSPKVISLGLSKGGTLLESMGRRLESYVSGQRPLPSLNESWCNSAYWFHEALLEPVEAVAVAQLETAIEVLLSAGSTTGSNARLLSAFDALLQKEATDPIAPKSPTDVKSFVAAIVTARSRVLHGTWSALSPDLPQRNGLSVRRADVEDLARALLIVASLQLDAYEAAGQQTDDILALLAWTKARRSPPAAAAAGAMP